MKLPVLITGCGGQSVGSGLIRSLSQDENYRIVAADMRKDCADLLASDASYLLPSAQSSNYQKAVLELCEREEIRAILPGSHWDSITLSRLAPEFAVFGIEAITNPWNTVKTAIDKLLCSQVLRQHGVAVPDFEPAENAAALVQRVGFPLVLKPVSGQGSKDVRIVHSMDELSLILQLHALKKDRMLVQQYVGSDDEEYTTGLAIAQSGRLLGSVTLRRTIRSGYTDCAVSVAGKAFLEVAMQAARALGASGPFNVQMRVHEGKPVIFEINPRFSGTAPMRARLGVPEARLLIQDRLFGVEEVLPEPPENSLVLRTLQENYFELRDMERIVDLRACS